MNNIATPFNLAKIYLDQAFQSVIQPPHETLLSSCEYLHHAVCNEDNRIGFLMSTEVKDVVQSEGSGLRLLGYNNPREWRYFNFIDSIPAGYAWVYTLYQNLMLDRIKTGNCGRCQFSISIPIQDRPKKKIFRSYVKIIVLDYQKEDHQPRLLLITIDLKELWSFSEPPIRSVGEFSNTAFPESMNEFNLKMQKQVSEAFLLNYFDINASQMRVLGFMNDGLPTSIIIEKMKASKDTFNFNKREIIKACKNHFGYLKDARQCVDFLCKMFIIDPGF